VNSFKYADSEKNCSNALPPLQEVLFQPFLKEFKASIMRQFTAIMLKPCLLLLFSNGSR
jgi:hypothetical protein